jgi:SAM-dependent methyltransferase
MTSTLRELIREQQVWGSDDSITFFSRERSRVDDLYSSERIFLPEITKRVTTILDVGCACGGFADIFGEINPDASYTGVDIVPDMIARAEAAHPEVSFINAPAHSMPFPDQEFDLVHCSGSVHLNSQYPQMIAEMWRVAGQYALFDMRLTDGPSVTGGFTVNFSGNEDGGRLPYNVVNINDAKAIIDELPYPPARTRLAGYRHPASANADLPGDTNVIMAFLLLERGGDETGWETNIQDPAD